MLALHIAGLGSIWHSKWSPNHCQEISVCRVRNKPWPLQDTAPKQQNKRPPQEQDTWIRNSLQSLEEQCRTQSTFVASVWLWVQTPGVLCTLSTSLAAVLFVDSCTLGPQCSQICVLMTKQNTALGNTTEAETNMFESTTSGLHASTADTTGKQ